MKNETALKLVLVQLHKIIQYVHGYRAIFYVGHKCLELFPCLSFFYKLDNKRMGVLVFSDFSGSNGRRESQGSLSSGASLELGTSGSGRNEVSLKGDIAT